MKPEPVKITISRDRDWDTGEPCGASIHMLYEPEVVPVVQRLAAIGGVVRVQRASYVLPVHPFYRALFKLVRGVCGDSGRGAAWTRRLPGPWIADMAPVASAHAGCTAVVLGPFVQRSEALRAERDYLLSHGFIVTGGK